MTRSARPSWIVVAFSVVALLAVSACRKPSDDNNANSGNKKKISSEEKKNTTEKPRREKTLKASQDDCVGPLVRSGKPRDISFGDWKFKLDGYLLTQTNKDPDEQIVVGIISDTKENTEENRKNLDKILDFFDKEKVQVIIHLGDIASVTPMPEEIDVPDNDKNGKPISEAQKAKMRRRIINKARRESMKKSYDDIVDMISILADTEPPRPVLVISGNRECKTVFNSAMATLAEDYPNVFNMNIIRRADLDDLDVISMPGYHDPDYVHCPWDKCLYFESDTLSLIELAKEANDEKLLISHGPPRQTHREGIDVVSEGANVGNPVLTDAIQKANIFFGAFGNIQEAGGKAVNLAGTTIIPQNTFVHSMYLNPGPADSMIWAMNDGTESKGMAAVMQFVGNMAKYKIFRIGGQDSSSKTDEGDTKNADEEKGAKKESKDKETKSAKPSK